MSNSGGKRNAFTALLQSAKKGGSTPKRQKVDAAEEQPSETPAKEAESNEPSSPGGPARMSEGEAAKDGAKGNAFARMMEQQRVQSRVHNFYLELTQQQTWRWRWFVTDAATDSHMMSQLGGNANSMTQPQEEAKASQTGSRAPGGEGAAAWGGLPPVCWHSLSQIPASKLGGSSHTKMGLRLLTNAPPGKAEDLGWSSPGMQSNKGGGRRYQGSISVVKSAMQKNVRLCRPESAVRCGLHLLKEDAGEFLRRCCIVCLEDCMLHPALPLMVWLMAAHSKGYIPTPAQACRCMAMLHHLADGPLKDRLPQGPSKQGGSCVQLWEDAADLTGDEAVLVRCLLCRAAWGGMPGDVELLKGFARRWADRFTGKAAAPPEVSEAQGTDWSAFIWDLPQRSHARLTEPDSQYNVTMIGPMALSDIPLSAVDFHVSSIVEELISSPAIAAKAQDLKVDASQVLRAAMWKYRSGLNSKRLLAPAGVEGNEDAGHLKIQALWEVASPLVEAWSQQFLSRRFH